MTDIVKLNGLTIPTGGGTSLATSNVVGADSSGSTAATTWRTLFDVTSFTGDLLVLYWLYNDGATDSWEFRVTVDGTLFNFTSTPRVGAAEVAIGPGSVRFQHMPFVASTSMKLEIYNYQALSKTLYWVYQYHILTFS